MRRHLSIVAVFALTLDAAAQVPPATTPAATATDTTARRPRAGIAIGEIAWVSGQVLRAQPPNKSNWKPVRMGEPVRTGDTVRTAEDTVTTIAFPWMEVTLGPSTMLTIPPTAVLSTVLDQGRAEFSGAGRDIVKIVVGDGEVRGGGRLVVRRSSALTAVSAFKGVFRVRAARRTVEIQAGQGTTVRAGAAPTPAASLPEGPAGLQPGAEVAYVRTGRPIDLRWKPSAAAGYHLEVLPIERERVLLARDTTAGRVRVELPWLGTYRWRVFSRDPRGVESRPSEEGLIAVVDR